MKLFIGAFVGLLLVSFAFKQFGKKQSYAVGVAKSEVSAKIDLSDKLNPQILPDVLREVLASIQVDGTPDKKEFQQKVVQKFSQKIMQDPDINYRVDLNEDGVIDPLMVVPESVDGEAAVYSLRVPDPVSYPQDPGSNADWDAIANKQSLELVEVSVTFDPNAKEVLIASSPNQNVYENSNSHYQQSYNSSGHSWIETYFQYRLFSMILFGPYGWGYGPFFGGFYNSWYSPYPASMRSANMANSRYSKAAATNRGPKTPSGKNISSSQPKSNPRTIQSMKSKRAMSYRKEQNAMRQGGFGAGKKKSAVSNNSNRSGSRFGGFGRSRSMSFGGGGSRGFGK